MKHLLLLSILIFTSHALSLSTPEEETQTIKQNETEENPYAIEEREVIEFEAPTDEDNAQEAEEAELMEGGIGEEPLPE